MIEALISANTGTTKRAAVVMSPELQLTLKQGTCTLASIGKLCRHLLPRVSRCPKLSVAPWEGYSMDDKVEGLCWGGTC